VADAADAAGRPAVVGHNFRHRALERTLRRALEAGAIGELRTATVSSARPAAAPVEGLPPHAPLWDLGVHHLDLLRLRLGAQPDAVDAAVCPSADGVTYRLHLDWDGRAAADYWLREGASVYHHAEWLEGSRGALRTIDGRAWLVTPDHRPRRLRPPRGPDGKAVLLDALRRGDAGTVSAREALGTIASVEAAARSLDLGRAVRLSELSAAPARAAS
jgi:predicted dehydrogenase